MKSWLFIISLFFAGSVYSRSDVYIISDAHQKEIGKLEVESIVDGEKEEIRVTSEIKVRKILTIVISYALHSIFVQNCLAQNNVITFRNKKIQDIMSTIRNSDGYLFTKNSKQKKIQNIPFCESMMYYNEPLEQKEIYSEFDGVFKSVRKTKENSGYELTNPINNNRSYYYYSKGVLERAVVNHALITLYLQRK